MRSFLILSFVLFFFSTASAQQTIDKLNVNELKLPKESVSKALYLDAFGKVKASADITDTELGYLNGLSDTLVNLLSGKANSTDTVNLTGNQSISGIKTFTGKLVASSTINGSVPCPVMTQIQRDATTPANGECVFNSTTLRLNVYDGSIWKDVGGAGGISLWVTANPYAVNDIIIESDKIYRCTTIHTSGTFATDLGLGYWSEVSASPSTPYSLANGGTNKALTAVNGGIVWVDADSFEILSAGVSGQILQSNGASAPSWVNKSISAKSENNASVVAEELQVPNNQLTLTDTNKHLVETGNNNILVNPSFEHSTFSTGWVNSAGTFTAESSVLVHGKKSAKLVLSSQTMSLTQSSTLYQAQFADSVQGLASIRVKSDVALKVCSIQAGVVSTSNCVDVQANSKWGLYKVPMSLGATSNGISIASTGAVTGTVYVDNAFVGAQDLTIETNACNSVSCETEFSAKISSAGVVSGENLDFINSSCTYSAGVATCTFNSNIFTVAPNCTAISLLSGNTATTMQNTAPTNTGFAFLTRDSSSGAAINRDIHVICQKQGADFTAAKQLSNGNTYSSTNADTDWASCQFSTLAWQGFGNVTSQLRCKRQGSDLLVTGKFTVGTTIASIARMPMPLWNGSQLTSSSIPGVQTVGHAARGNSVANGIKDLVVLASPSVQYLEFSYPEFTQAQSPLSAVNGSAFVSTGEAISLDTIRIPIEGWQNSNIIIGQFNGLERCIDSYECTDVFSAKVSAAGVVSEENIDWINGNCSLAGASFTCTYKTGVFTVTPNCTVVNASGNAGGQAILDSTATTSIVAKYNTANAAGAGSAQPATLICQKQGVDYIGKTAKAVASDQNVRSIGAVGVDIQSVYFGIGANCDTACTTGTCNICHQVGSKITSVTWDSTGTYRVNGIDGLKYSCISNGYSGTTDLTAIDIRSASTSSYKVLSYRSSGVAANTAFASVVCTGIP